MLPCFSAAMILNSLVTGMATVVRFPPAHNPPPPSPSLTPSLLSSPEGMVERYTFSICVSVNKSQAGVALQTWQ